MHTALMIEALAYGATVGIALGLTGGGGATLAVPLLVFGLAVDPPHAVAISLLSVGAAAVGGFLHRLRRGEVDLGAGSVLAGGGMIAAPIGAWIGGRMPPLLLLGLFGGLIVLVSVRLWRTAGRRTDLPSGPCAVQRRLSVRCVSTLTGAGLTTGLLSGLFGVGGGFVVVPAIVFATGATMHRAVATSLMVVSIVSAAALTAMIVSGREIAWSIALPFLAGSLGGMAIGTSVGRWLSGPRLQQTFAAALAVVGLFVIVRSVAR